MSRQQIAVSKVQDSRRCTEATGLMSSIGDVQLMTVSLTGLNLSLSVKVIDALAASFGDRCVFVQRAHECVVVVNDPSEPSSDAAFRRNVHAAIDTVCSKQGLEVVTN